MPSKDPELRCEDILDNADRIRRFLSGMKQANFSTTRRRRMRSSIACSGFPRWLRSWALRPERQVPDQSWREIRGLGNILRHEYDRIEIETIWRIATVNMAALSSAVRARGR